MVDTLIENNDIAPFKNILNNVELTSDMVNSLIERIELSYYTKLKDGIKERRIIIKYKFIDNLLQIQKNGVQTNF